MLRNFLCYVCFLSLVVVNSSLFFLAMFKVLITFLLFSAHAHYCVLGTFVFSLCSKFLSLFCFFLHMLITVFWARLFLLVFALRIFFSRLVCQLITIVCWICWACFFWTCRTCLFGHVYFSCTSFVGQLHENFSSIPVLFWYSLDILSG